LADGATNLVLPAFNTPDEVRMTEFRIVDVAASLPVHRNGKRNGIAATHVLSVPIMLDRHATAR
jgi:hypothetical protein